MKQLFTGYLKSAMLALALGTGYTALGQTYTPVALTGFNQDVIAEGTGSALNLTSYDVDGSGAGYSFMSANYVNPAGTAPTVTRPLPNNGTLTSIATATTGLTFQLGSYSANNVLRVPATGSTGTGTGVGTDAGTVAFASSTAASTVYVLVTGGGGAIASGVRVTFTFSDGTTQVFTGQSISDWFSAGTATVAYQGFGRVARTAASAIDNASATTPNLYQLSFALAAGNTTKPISSITFGKTTTASGVIDVFAVSIVPTTTGVTACSGLPTAGTATADVPSACTSTYLNLGLTGATTDANLAYQWQYSTNNTTWTNIPTSSTTGPYSQNANAVTCAVTNQTAATYYRCQVSCLNTTTPTPVASTSVQVTQSPATSCYCVPPGRTSTSTSYTTVSAVSLPGDGGTTLSNAPGAITSTSAGYVSANYALYPASTTTTTLTANGSYTLSATVSSFTRASVWIDFDQNGTFDANEFFILRTATNALYGSATTNVLTATITPPTTAVAGPTKMRLRVDYYTQAALNTYTGACGATMYGQAMDYTVTLVAATACAGTPATPVASASATGVCATTGFTLTTPAVVGASGLSYQWQSSPAGANTFTNLGTTQTTTSYSVASITASTDYRVVVTCANGGLTATSNVVSVALNYLTCYCTPVSGAGGEYIKGVTLPGTPGFTNTTGAASTSGYGDFTGNATYTTTLTQGSTYTNGISVLVHSNNTNSQGGMWIDYDHSGTFDPSEYTYIGTSSLINTDVTLSATLVVPTTALLGQTRVRVRWRNGAIAATEACVTGATTWYGETEDYFITIAAPTTCSAPPATVAATADVTNACANASFTLSTSSVPTTLGGYSYQWQSRTGTNAFANIAGATTNPYTITSQTVATDYQLVVSCQYGGTSVTSNIVSVGQNSFNQCYCTASSTNVCSNYGVITSVALGTINNPSGCTSANSYSDYTSQSTSLAAGSTATLTLGVASATSTYNYNYGVWIDFNQNGTFEASEFVANSTAAVSATSVVISLPISALSGSVLAGATRIRIRTNAGLAAYGLFTATGANSACGAVYNGETEDYTVNIVPCTSTATFSYPAGSYCASGTASLTPTVTGTTGGTFSSTTGLSLDATTGAITLNTSTPGTYTVTYAVAGTCPASSTQSVTINAAPTAGFSYPATTVCAGNSTTFLAALATGATAGTYTLPTATGLSINAATGTLTIGSTAAAGTYTVTNTVAASGGCAAVTSMATFTITPRATATFSYPAASYCTSSTTSAAPTITGTTGGTFSSTTGLVINATTGAITPSGSTPGTYTVVYNINTTCGASGTQTVTITAPATAGFSYPTTTACAGTATTRTPTLAAGATAGAYTLPAATGLSVNATTGVVTIGTTAAAGTYTVTNTVAASGGCAAVATTATFTISAAPATPTLTTSGTPATGILLTSSAATGNQFYLNGVAIGGATGQTYLINSGSQNGSYTVVVTNAAGCSATSAAIAVTVTAAAPSAAATSLTLYPNPTRDGLLTLELSGYREPVQVSVLNALGQRVYEATVSNSALTQRQALNLSALPTGVYLLQARTASGSLELRRIVRE